MFISEKILKISVLSVYRKFTIQRTNTTKEQSLRSSIHACNIQVRSCESKQNFVWMVNITRSVSWRGITKMRNCVRKIVSMEESVCGAYDSGTIYASTLSTPLLYRIKKPSCIVRTRKHSTVIINLPKPRDM